MESLSVESGGTDLGYPSIDPSPESDEFPAIELPDDEPTMSEEELELLDLVHEIQFPDIV